MWESCSGNLNDGNYHKRYYLYRKYTHEVMYCKPQYGFRAIYIKYYVRKCRDKWVNKCYIKQAKVILRSVNSEKQWTL